MVDSITKHSNTLVDMHPLGVLRTAMLVALCLENLKKLFEWQRFRFLGSETGSLHTGAQRQDQEEHTHGH